METRESLQKGGDGNGSGPSQESRPIIRPTLWQPPDFIGRLPRHAPTPDTPPPAPPMNRPLPSLAAPPPTWPAPLPRAHPGRGVAGKHYTVTPPQRTQVPAGKIEVM